MFVGDNDHGDTKPTYYHKEFNSRVAVLEDRLEHVMTDRNNLELRVDELVRKTEELELALSVAQVENNELNELLAEADDNVLWLSNDVSIAEEELRLARKEICHMACSEDLFSYKGQTPVEVAYYMGWDCFKEER
jgi:chromosome segregation ATPase